MKNHLRFLEDTSTIKTGDIHSYVYWILPIENKIRRMEKDVVDNADIDAAMKRMEKLKIAGGVKQTPPQP